MTETQSNSIEVTRSTGFFTPNVNAVKVNQRQGLVYMMLDDKIIEMRTPAAHKTGLALVKQAGEALHNEFVVLKINGYALNFPSKNATQVGAALLRKSDDADDFQKRIN